MTRGGPRRRAARRGFTIVEMGVVCMMTALLAALLAAVWAALCVPAITASSICRLAQEAELAAAALARDLGGTYPAEANADTRLFTLADGALTGVTAADGGTLQLTFSVNGSSRVVTYDCSTDGRLIRHDTSGDVVVASDVRAFRVDAASAAPWVLVSLTFNFDGSGLRDRVYQFAVRDPAAH